MKKILGIDPSLTGTGLALATKSEKGVVKWEHLSVAKNKLRGHERLHFITDAVMCSVAIMKPDDIIVMEGPSFNSGGAKSHELSGSWWLIRHAIYEWEQMRHERFENLFVVPPRSRAKYATGKGNAKKPEVIEAVNRWYPGCDVVDDNVADAMVLATMGARFCGSHIDEVLPEEFDRLTPLATMKRQ